jgi:hypothetical protein
MFLDALVLKPSSVARLAKSTGIIDRVVVVANLV